METASSSSWIVSSHDQEHEESGLETTIWNGSDDLSGENHNEEGRGHREEDDASVIGISLNRQQTKRYYTPLKVSVRHEQVSSPTSPNVQLQENAGSDLFIPTARHLKSRPSKRMSLDLSKRGHQSSIQSFAASPHLDDTGKTRMVPSQAPEQRGGNASTNRFIPRLNLSLSSLPGLTHSGRSSLADHHSSADGSVQSLPHMETETQATAGSTNPSKENHEVSTSPPPYKPIETDVERQQQFQSTPRAYDASRTLRPSPLLRRATSADSLPRSPLSLARTISHTPSFGDGTNWDGVHNQVNSRVKAIKDSFADSSIRLPKLPSFTSLRASSLLDRASIGRNSSPKLASNDAASGDSGRDMPGSEAQTFADTSPTQTPGTTNRSAQTHPHFTRALQNLTGDIVILGGYRGSVLRSAEPPHRQLWVPIKVGLNLRKADLEVGLDPEDERTEPQRIIPSGMLSHIGPIDISRRLIKRLRACHNAVEGKLRIWDFGYDWRLSPHLLTKYLIEFLEGLPSNKNNVSGMSGALVVAHSLGGLITRNAVNQRPQLFSGVVYAGVPQTCVNILGPLRNGDDVLISSRVLTAQVNFTIRTSFALLPLDGKCFLNRETKEEYPVDFFDVNTWDEHRLSPCINRPLPPLVPFEPPRGRVGTIVGSMASVLPKGRRGSSPRAGVSGAKGDALAVAGGNEGISGGRGVAPQMDSHGSSDPTSESNVATKVTISRDDAMRYLQRTLADVKKFKQELAHRPELENEGLYPPLAVMYTKSVATVVGAYVRDREAIKHADAFDNLAFASGDGVVLARAAQLPKGYKACRHGIAESDRGHVTLLGDLEAVGKCLNAIMAEQRRRTRRA